MRTLFLILITCLFVLPAHAKYSGGTGEPNDPYQIATAADLIALGETPEDYDKHFILTADIDLDPNLPGRKVFATAVIAPDVNDMERWLQGTLFSGVFDGHGHVISHLTIRGGEYVGLFGQLLDVAEVRDLGIVDADVRGSGSYVGGLVACNGEVVWAADEYEPGGTVTRCYATGAVSGERANVGGLVGYNCGSLTDCYSIAVVSGNDSVGGLVGVHGYEDYGTLTRCYSMGAVSGEGGVGGLIGMNSYSPVIQCHSAGTVQGIVNVGGLVGEGWHCSVTECYSTGMVTGTESVGGLIGYASETKRVQDSYSRASVLGREYVGGLIGETYTELYGQRISRCYSAGPVTGESNVGGLLGSGGSSVPNASFWDTEISGRASSAEGTGKTTAEMQIAKTFLDAGWDFVGETANGTEDIWKIVEGQTYPLLSWQKYSGGTGEPNDPYQIATAEDLIALGETPEDYGKHFILTADIDLDPNLPGRKVFDKAVIAPVQLNPWDEEETSFTGVFDGKGHVISRLTITGQDDLGLFGQLRGQARNLGIVDANVAGSGGEIGGLAAYVWPDAEIIECHSAGTVRAGGGVGGLVGWNDGALTRCYSTGAVSGESDVGGLVGQNNGAVIQCYSSGVVSGTHNVGGLVGCEETGYLVQCYSTCVVNGAGWCIGGLVGTCQLNTVTQCYSTGAVRGQNDVGGLIGHASKVIIWDSYWDIESSGQTISAGGTGKTTAEMQTAKTFLDAGWDFVGETANGPNDVWRIAEGLDYPRLWWEPYDGRVTVALGQIFTVTLESNPSTGYRWEWVDHQDSIVEQMGEAQFKPRETGDPPLVGAGGWESFDFKAVHQGQMTLKLVYRRPWEEGVEPLKTFSLQVTVP